MKNKLSKSSKSLMTCDLTNSIVSLFGETFLVAYFLQISNENIVQVSTYYIIIYALLGLGNILLGNILKKNPKNRVIIYRIGIVVKSIYILLIVLLKERISQYFMLFAMFYGISEALYWSAHGVMDIEVVDDANRKKYMTTKRIVSKIIHIAVPIVLGTSIELMSFTNISIYIFALTIIQIIISLSIDIRNFEKNERKERYSLKDYRKELSEEKKAKIGKVYQLSFFYGIIMDTIRVLVIVITIMTFKTSLNLGVLTTIFSILSMISLYLFNKFYQRKYAKILLTISSMLVVIGVLGLLINISKPTLILYHFTYSITICILEVMFKIKVGNTVKEYHIEKRIVEYHTLMEAFMDTGRVTGFLLMLLIGLWNNIMYFKLLLLVVTICIPVYARIMYKVEQ